jgi:hypothetical protein
VCRPTVRTDESVEPRGRLHTDAQAPID